MSTSFDRKPRELTVDCSVVSGGRGGERMTEGVGEGGVGGGGEALRRSGEIAQPLERHTAHRIRHWNWGTGAEVNCRTV